MTAQLTSQQPNLHLKSDQFSSLAGSPQILDWPTPKYPFILYLIESKKNQHDGHLNSTHIAGIKSSFEIWSILIQQQPALLAHS